MGFLYLGHYGPDEGSCFAQNGINYQAYNTTEPYGEIVQYEKIIELGQKGLALYNSFK